MDYITCKICGRSYQAVNWSHLHFKHRLSAEDAVNEYKSEFGVDRVFAQEVSRRSWEGRRRWEPKKIPNLLREMKRRGEGLSHAKIRRRYPGFVDAVIRHFGSYRAALHAAGIDPKEAATPPKWTRERMRSVVQSRVRKGLALNANAVGHALQEAAKRLFGSWDRALRFAGVNPEKTRLSRIWTPNKVLMAIRKERKAGRPLWYQAVCGRDLGLLNAAVTRFGSWKEAIEAAEVDLAYARPPARSPSKEQVKEMILDRARRGKPLYWDAIQASFQNGARKHFGSWSAALAACGIIPTDVRRVRLWTPERVKETILDLAARGLALNSAAVTARNGSIVGRARMFFGSWEAAIQACGLDYERIRQLHPWTKERAREMILDRKAKELPLNPVEVQKGQYLLYAMSVKVYGSWPAALKASGIEPDSVYVLRQWTEEGVRAALVERARSGKSLRRADVFREDRGLAEATVRRFGQWDHAAASCGLAPPKRRSKVAIASVP